MLTQLTLHGEDPVQKKASTLLEKLGVSHSALPVTADLSETEDSPNLPTKKRKGEGHHRPSHKLRKATEETEAADTVDSALGHDGVASERDKAGFDYTASHMSHSSDTE